MDKSPNITPQTLRVLDALMSSNQQLSGAEIAKTSGLASGTLYPILLRLEDAGMVVSNWEEGDPSLLGRPRRRYYTVTGLGASRAQAAARSMRSFVGRLGWA